MVLALGAVVAALCDPRREVNYLAFCVKATGTERPLGSPPVRVVPKLELLPFCVLPLEVGKLLTQGLVLGREAQEARCSLPSMTAEGQAPSD